MRGFVIQVNVGVEITLRDERRRLQILSDRDLVASLGIHGAAALEGLLDGLQFVSVRVDNFLAVAYRRRRLASLLRGRNSVQLLQSMLQLALAVLAEGVELLALWQRGFLSDNQLVRDLLGFVKGMRRLPAVF